MVEYLESVTKPRKTHNQLNVPEAGFGPVSVLPANKADPGRVLRSVCLCI